jgi:hypothetical protein
MDSLDEYDIKIN